MIRRLIHVVVMLLAWLSAGPGLAATYTFRSDNFAWETAANAIAWDKTCTSYPGDDDQATINFTGGLVFPFAGTNYSSVRVLSNGGLQFGSNTGFYRNYGNTALPAGTAYTNGACTATATTNVILAYWTDLNPSQAGSGGVTWEQKGSAPNRYVVFSWNAVYQYNTSTPYTFQIILYENGEFKYQYGNANATGSNATIGVQINSSDYTQYSYNSGYNANGSAIRWFIPSGSPTRLAEYRFEQYSYSGTVGEVIDSSGNSYHGVRAGTATTTASGYICRGLSVPSNTTSSSNGADTLLDVNSAIGNAGAVTFWYSANTSWSSAAAMLLDATSSSTRPFFLVRQSDGSLRASIADSAGTVLSAVTPAQSVSAGSWRHLAVSWRFTSGAGQSSIRIYLNGVQIGAASGTTTGVVDTSATTLLIGDNRSSALPTNATYNSANGTIDEVRVYNYDISAVELNADMSATHSCTPPLHHLEIQHSSGSGVTCAPSTLTVRACADAACSTLFTDGLTGIFSATGSPTVVWDGSSGNASGANFAITAGSSSVTKNLQVTTPGSILLGISATTPTASNSTTCNFGSPSCTFTASDSGFVVSVPNHVAESSQTATIQAVRKSDNSAACSPAFTSVTKSVTLACSYANPSSGTLPVRVAGTALNASNSTSSACSAAGAAVNLSFNASGVASPSLQYADVGSVNLSARYTSTSGSDAGLDMQGSTSFTAKPAGFTLSNIRCTSTGSGNCAVSGGGSANPSAADQNGGAFIPAGSPFSVTVTAINSAGNATTNYGQESPAESVKLTHNLVQPAGGNVGSLANGSNFGSFTAGVATGTAFSWSEVGIITLSPSVADGDYLGQGNVTGTTSSNVGRFVPANFALSSPVITHRADTSCAPASTFTYLDENFQLAFTLSAQNVSGGTTQNYTGGFAKLDLTNPGSLGLAGIAGSTVFKSTGANPRLGLVASTGSWSNGVTQGLTLTAQAKRSTSAIDGPFDTAQFGIAALDSDGVGMRSLTLDTDSPANGADATLLGQIPLRWGRLRLQNAIGAASRSLALPLVAQYWNGTAFATHTSDSCTRVSASNLSFGNLRPKPGNALLTGDLAMSPSSLQLSNGVAALTLAAPNGHAGSVDLAIALSTTATDSSCLTGWSVIKSATAGASLPYLQGAWCGSSTSKDPSARATFGAYRGADGVLFQRENY